MKCRRQDSPSAAAHGGRRWEWLEWLKSGVENVPYEPEEEINLMATNYGAYWTISRADPN